MDSLHVLPLVIIPLTSRSLQRTRLIKGAHLDSAVELYRGEGTGSGQVSPKDLRAALGWPPNQGREDERVVRSLGELSSFDVFSLRIDLRRVGIEVNDHSELRLSDERKEQLGRHMRRFTRPLLTQVYGENAQMQDIDQLFAMFKDPDTQRAMQNLRRIADHLKITVHELPVFLEEYGDIFLSLAYFTDCFDRIAVPYKRFIRSTGELANSYSGDRRVQLASTCRQLHKTLEFLFGSVRARFSNFDKRSQTLWDDLNQESFGQFRDLIQSHHTTLGGVLCGLTLKIKFWEDRIEGTRANRAAQVDFITSDMHAGMSRIVELAAAT